MAAENSVESLQEETTCPICLEYFTEPVILECGHNFCQACIAQCWEGSDTVASCPQCRETVQQRNLRPNRQLANVIEIAKQLSLQAAKGAGGHRVCGEHQEGYRAESQWSWILLSIPAHMAAPGGLWGWYHCSLSLLMGHQFSTGSIQWREWT
uniref:RING-type domain-containing protein n=1 Tax=Chelonoidis abingdonii TaxID=106734 RepID=A0A8C0JC87_CHEAB